MGRSTRNAIQKEQKVSSEKSQEQLRDVLDLMSKFSGVVDRKGRLQFASEAAVKALGYSEDDILKKPFWEAGWFAKSPQSQKSIKQSVLGALGGESAQCQVETFTKDGESIPVTFTMHPLKGKDGDIVSIVAETDALLEDETEESSEVAEKDASSTAPFMQEAYFP